MAKRSADETIRVPIKLPFKGVNRNFARGSQPEGTCWDAKNVLPFDRQGRLRLALRGGASVRDDLGTASKVRMLHVASTVFSPSPSASFSWSEPFNYSNGNLAGQGGWQLSNLPHIQVENTSQIYGAVSGGNPIVTNEDALADANFLAPWTLTFKFKLETGRGSAGFYSGDITVGNGNVSLFTSPYVNFTFSGNTANFDYELLSDTLDDQTISLDAEHTVAVSYDPSTDRVSATLDGNPLISDVWAKQNGPRDIGNAVSILSYGVTYTDMTYVETEGGFEHVFSDTFNLTNGNLTGQGGWTEDVPSPETSWVVSFGSLVTSSAGHGNEHALTGFSTDNGFWLSTFLRFTTGSSAALKTFTMELRDTVTNAVLWAFRTHETGTGVVTHTVTKPDGTTLSQAGITQTRGLFYDYELIYDSDDEEVKVRINGTDQPSLTGSIAPPDSGSAYLRIIGGQQTATTNGGVVGLTHVAFSEQLHAAEPPINRTALKLIATSGEDTFVGTDPSSMGVVTNSGTFPIANSFFVSAATLFGFTYIVDGTNIYKLDLSDNQFDTFTASAGSLPSGATIAVAWRGRLVVSGDPSDPQNVKASALGDPSDWDFGVDPPTETMAWALNASTLGRIGAPVLALIPLSDDILLVGCEDSVWAVRGDPAANGSVDNISESAGILSHTAWCRAADGSVYFVGPNGLYRAASDGSSPVEISRDTFRQFFQGINRQTEHVSLVYDKQRYGVWIFVTPEIQSTARQSLFYDLRLEGYWPIAFDHLVKVGPISAVYWDGFEDSTRYPLLGGYTGELYSLNFNSRRDIDGVSNQLIEGYVVIGPFSLSSIDDAIFTKLDITGGEVRTGDDSAVWHMTWTVNGGADAYDVTEGTPLITASGELTADGRAQTQYPRVRGGWFTIRIGNEFNDGDYFTIESVVGHLIPAGTQRV